MQTPKLITFILLLLIILPGISCKKSKNTNFSTIKIATVDYASGNMRQHYIITYDKYNNVDSISDNGGGVDTGAFSFKKFNYIGSSFTITDQTGGIYMVDANTNGQILEVLLTDTLLMTYDGNELTKLSYKQPSSTYPFYTLTSYTYQWNNGDIASYSLSGVVDSYYYDQSRSGQEGDALRIGNFLQYGRSYISTSHLATEKEMLGTWGEEYLYKFDVAGRISQLTKVTNQGPAPNTNDTETYAYTYY